jgi:hypothetical protein
MYSRHICGGWMACESEEITLRIDIYASLAVSIELVHYRITDLAIARPSLAG